MEPIPLGPAGEAQQTALPSRPSQSGIPHRPHVSKSHLCNCVLALPQCHGQALVPPFQPMSHSFIHPVISFMPSTVLGIVRVNSMEMVSALRIFALIKGRQLNDMF